MGNDLEKDDFLWDTNLILLWTLLISFPFSDQITWKMHWSWSKKKLFWMDWSFELLIFIPYLFNCWKKKLFYLDFLTPFKTRVPITKTCSDAGYGLLCPSRCLSFDFILCQRVALLGSRKICLTLFNMVTLSWNGGFSQKWLYFRVVNISQTINHRNFKDSSI